MIIEDRKVIILHPPKTGGQAVQQGLTGTTETPQGKIWRHDPLSEILKKRPGVAPWKVFLLIRNPYERMVSFYHHHTQKSQVGDAPARDHLRSFESCSDWLENGDFSLHKPNIRNHRDATIGPCMWYLTYGMEYPYPESEFVTIEHRLLSIAIRANFDAEIPEINQTKHDDWQSYYSEKSRKRVWAYMWPDFKYLEDPEAIN